MKFILLLAFILQTTFLAAQNSTKNNSIEQPVYDTTSMDIKSTNSFYFCSVLYKIPRDCDKNNQSNCCSFTSQTFRNEKDFRNGQIACYDGSSLHWNYYDNEKIAKSNFESQFPQMQKQMKKFEKTEIKLTICQKPVIAYRVTGVSLQGYHFSEIRFYGTINGYIVIGELTLNKNESSSAELTPFFQQIVQF